MMVGQKFWFFKLLASLQKTINKPSFYQHMVLIDFFQCTQLYFSSIEITMVEKSMTFWQSMIVAGEIWLGTLEDTL